jgi:all-trans-retinol 13,14-reductase
MVMTESGKQGKHFSTRSEDREWDYVVIGSGMGGMVSAALLSKLGKRVLILEQHYVPGGFTHTFKRKKWVWDVGVHAVGEVSDRAVLGKILSELTDHSLQWTSLGPVYDEFHFPDLSIDFPDGRPQFVENLLQAFPQERDAVEQYIRSLRDVAGVMRRYYLSRLVPPEFATWTDPVLAGDAFRLLTERTKDVLDRMSNDPRFKAVLTSQWGYYGAPPSRSSYAIHALVAKHFMHGGFYPVGGSARIAECLLATVHGAGGWTRINAEVEQILVHDRQVRGVQLKSGEVIRAKKVISAAGALATVKRLLPEAERHREWAGSIARLNPSPCHVCLYVGFKGDITQAGASAANKWFYESWDSEADTWHVDDSKAIAPVLYCSFPSLKDPRHDPGGEMLHTGEVVTFVPYSVFAPWKDGRWKRRGEDYEAFKQSLSDRLLEQFLNHLPGLRPFVAFTELSTPLSTEHFTRAASGAIYGLEPTPERYKNPWLRPRTPVRNLFLSGSDMATVGVIGAMVGGLLAAVAAEPVGGIKYIRGVTSREGRNMSTR